jgi:putative transposase
MLDAYHQLRVVVSHRNAAGLCAVSRATAHRRDTPQPAGPVAARPVPANRLSDTERARILAVLNSDRFVDTTPVEVYATLLSEGVYLASVATLYRVLREHRQVADRRRQARHPTRKRPELTATGPGQIFSWDITKLPAPGRGQYFDAYVMIDIYSRYVVGWMVAATENAELAEGFIADVVAVHGAPLAIHADRGTSMTSKKVADLLDDLHIKRSHSRPHVSNDNPYSEAAFKTVKYHPTFPQQFGSIQDARAFCDRFFAWYNHEHHHSGIGLHTPADVHYGHAVTTAQARQTALDTAWAAHPERFGRRPQPKALELPETAWINKPEASTDEPLVQAA